MTIPASVTEAIRDLGIANGIDAHLKAKRAVIAAVQSALDEARAEELRKVVKVLCPMCNPRHVLDSGHVWGFCDARRLLGQAGSRESYTEVEIAAAIRAKETR
jgi:hypothetical protein